jgi:hypothetical protein
MIVSLGKRPLARSRGARLLAVPAMIAGFPVVLPATSAYPRQVDKGRQGRLSERTKLAGSGSQYAGALATIVTLGTVSLGTSQAAAADETPAVAPDVGESVAEPARPPISAGHASNWDGNNPPGPAPDGYQWRLLPKRSLVDSGFIIWGIGYGLTLLDILPGLVRSRDIDVWWLALPVVGPPMALATQHETCEMKYTPPHCGRSNGTIRAMAILTAVQVLGAGLIAWGELDRKWQLEPWRTTTLSVLPMPMGQSGLGLSALGHF